jgi:hypothetical protein
LNIVFAVTEFKLLFIKVVVPKRVVKSFAGTLELTPPPVKYLTVNVVLEGAIP